MHVVGCAAAQQHKYFNKKREKKNPVRTCDMLNTFALCQADSIPLQFLQSKSILSVWMGMWGGGDGTYGHSCDLQTFREFSWYWPVYFLTAEWGTVDWMRPMNNLCFCWELSTDGRAHTMHQINRYTRSRVYACLRKFTSSEMKSWVSLDNPYFAFAQTNKYGLI